jgi:hypothetical protein
MHHLYTCSAYESEKVRVEQVLRRLVLINLQKVSSTSGVGEGHPSMVLGSSIRGVGAKPDFCELTSLQRRQAPDIQTLFCFINALLHLKSSVMYIMLVGVG